MSELGDEREELTEPARVSMPVLSPCEQRCVAWAVSKWNLFNILFMARDSFPFLSSILFMET